MILLPDKPGEHDQHAYHRRGCRRDGSSGHLHAQRIDKYIVKDDVRQASHDHAGHGQAGRAVISREAEQKVVAEKKGREDQQDADIIGGIAGGLGVRSEEYGDLLRQEEPRAAEDHGGQRRKVQCLAENGPVQFAAGLRGGDRVPGGCAHADHQTGAVHQAVCRKDKVQRRKRVRADPPGNEKCVRENVAGIADHAEHICGDIPEKKWKKRRIVFS